MSTIVVTEDVTGRSFDELSTRRSLHRDPTAWNSPETLRGLLADAEAVVVRNRTQVNQQFLDAAPNLRVVARAGVGLDNIDLAAADRAGVVVVAPVGANAISVAEHAMAMALGLAKNLLSADASTKDGGWDRTPTLELGGYTWGLLSAGATARATGRLAKALGMDVIAYDPYIDPQDLELVRIGIKLAALETVLATSHVLSAHLPSNDATRHLLNAERLALLPQGALVINVGRGEVIDETALLDALDSGRIAGAGLDVRGQEPPIPGRLEKHPHVILTPHIAGITFQAQQRIGEILCRQIDLVLDGAPATSAVGMHSIPARTAVL